MAQVDCADLISARVELWLLLLELWTELEDIRRNRAIEALTLLGQRYQDGEIGCAVAEGARVRIARCGGGEQIAMALRSWGGAVPPDAERP